MGEREREGDVEGGVDEREGWMRGAGERERWRERWREGWMKGRGGEGWMRERGG